MELVPPCLKQPKLTVSSRSCIHFLVAIIYSLVPVPHVLASDLHWLTLILHFLVSLRCLVLILHLLISLHCLVLIHLLVSIPH